MKVLQKKKKANGGNDMTKQTMENAVNNIGDKYVEEAAKTKKKMPAGMKSNEEMAAEIKAKLAVK